MNIDFDLIKQKYPKAFDKFINYLIEIKNLHGNLYFIENIIYNLLNDKNFICYCDLEKFFDNNNIIIEICLDIRVLFSNEKKWFVNFFFINKLFQIEIIQLNNSETDFYFNTRDEAKEQSVLKAFEILKEQLNENRTN